MEDVAAYCRAVIDGDFIFMSGTMGVDKETGKLPPSFPEQADNAFKIVEETLAKANSSLEDVVHVRLFVSDRAYLRDMVIKLQEKFMDIRPAQTMIIAQMPSEEAFLEVEVTARRQS
tara:strand:- start:1765 stop:2115 length:351 start_codon:yes stop_codon:yes gene_type:complete